MPSTASLPTDPVPPDSILDQWTSWLTTDAPRRLASTTIHEYRRLLVQFACWLEATLDLPFLPMSISAYRMECYLASIEAQITANQRRHATYNKAVAALTAFGHWLVAAGYCTDTPARRLRTLPEQPRPFQILDRTVVIKVLDAAHHTGDLRDAVVVGILAHTGLRAHELANIHIEDLDIGRRTTWIRVVGKGQKQRQVPLPKAVGQTIQDYLQQRAHSEQDRPTRGPLIVGERGGITRTTVNRIVAKVARAARLSETERRQVTPHAFRHTVATQVARAHDLVIAADLLGHSSLTTTRRYTKASARELEVAVETLYRGTESSP